MWNSTFTKPGKPLKAKKPMARAHGYLRSRRPKADKPKRAAREAEDRDLFDLCRGRLCYLLVPGCVSGPTVGCHSNQLVHGKGKSLKAHNRFTVPGCPHCHFEIDQGTRYTREEKFAYWDSAFERWVPVRKQLLEQGQ
jgi:hypothetical protein